MNLPNSKPFAKVGILGGSFDPPHLGHQLLALAALSTLDIDELWIIPCANHAFQKRLSSFEHRYQMCQLAFSRLLDTHVLSLEKELPPPNYTIQTVNKILEKRSDLSLTLVMGSDLREQLDTWEGAEQLKQKCHLSIFDRALILPGAQSTQIRENVLKQNYSNLDLWVQKYIQKHSIYKTPN